MVGLGRERVIIIKMDQNGRQQNKQQEGKFTRFYLGSRQRYITISSSFDSGNIRVVKHLSDFQFRLECCEDGAFTGRPVNSKSWFYFRVSGFPRNTRGRFFVSRLQALSSIFYSKYAKCYRPVCRVQGQEWRRLEGEVPLTLRDNGDLECTIDYTFQEEDEAVEFAFCYPYQYSQLCTYLGSLDPFRDDPDLYFHKEVLVESPQRRPVHLLTITSHDDAEKEREALFDESLFPQRFRPLRFRKPVVLITARVHPGETPASFAMEGVVDFLTNKGDLRAHLLRKMFVFMVVPMINVDGVFHGHFRMDTFGRNLNRFYIAPDRAQQPAIYAIKKLATHLIGDNRLSFYFDLHAHNAKKGCFIYGNAFSDFVEQVESQVFCKLFSINHSGFEYESCNFTEKHMNAKDRFEDLTKEGCGRVVMHKTARIIHSYSLECGILAPNHLNEVCSPANPDFRVGEMGFVRERVEEEAGEGERLFDGSVLFTEGSYRNLGKNLLVSILDVFDKNPYSRVYNSRYKSLDMLRRLTAFEIFHSAERFRMFERFIFGKVKNINVLIQEIMNNKIHYKQLYNCYFAEDAHLRDVEWPRNIQGLNKAPRLEPSKLRKLKSISQTKLTTSDDPERKEDLHKASLRDTSCRVIEEPIHQEEDLLHECAIIPPQEAKEQPLPEVKLAGEAQSKEQLQAELKAEGELDEKGEDKSDLSEVEETEMNHQILLMCQNEREEKEILSKIMHNNFNEKDYEQIQQKFKHKNSQEEEDRIEKISNISFSHTENTNKYAKIHIVRENSANRDHQYRLSKRLNIINTQQLYMKHKPQKPIPDEKSTINNSSIENKMEVVEIKKLSAAEEFRKNIYDSIKQEIKESLRREYERKKQKERLENKLIDSFRFKKHPRLKQPPGHLSDPKQIKSKVRLPSLGSNMYIITTSTRLINKN